MRISRSISAYRLTVPMDLDRSRDLVDYNPVEAHGLIPNLDFTCAYFFKGVLCYKFPCDATEARPRVMPKSPDSW